ncbi:hypothetical protein [Candidatus Synchoanobacter obligatus]|uniref:Uncharacterized protein n=1 Tax=Candidatus Synchoanobacter obligatus TaxID=2919597 RepID=A0ABT1L4J2_9GAMM|nr:hypothetical protein [Candidatus Synchoanobacter obligatus]MCP8351783.1 hypothetical protein [Candidatus Synchoanobacter obligatus]
MAKTILFEKSFQVLIGSPQMQQVAQCEALLKGKSQKERQERVKVWKMSLERALSTPEAFKVHSRDGVFYDESEQDSLPIQTLALQIFIAEKWMNRVVRTKELAKMLEAFNALDSTFLQNVSREVDDLYEAIFRFWESIRLFEGQIAALEDRLVLIQALNLNGVCKQVEQLNGEVQMRYGEHDALIAKILKSSLKSKDSEALTLAGQYQDGKQSFLANLTKLKQRVTGLNQQDTLWSDCAKNMIDSSDSHDIDVSGAYSVLSKKLSVACGFAEPKSYDLIQWDMFAQHSLLHQDRIQSRRNAKSLLFNRLLILLFAVLLLTGIALLGYYAYAAKVAVSHLAVGLSLASISAAAIFGVNVWQSRELERRFNEGQKSLNSSPVSSDGFDETPIHGGAPAEFSAELNNAHLPIAGL